MTAVLDFEHEYTAECIPNFSMNEVLPRHRWYFFKEGFSAALVEKAIAESQRNPHQALNILDPFSGSGTTAVVAASGGHRATGIEVNPFMHFVGRAKCWNPKVSFKTLFSQLNDILGALPREVDSPLEQISTFAPRPGLDKWLFNRDVLRGFEALRSHINEIASDPDPFMLALYGGVMDCSNARRDGKCLRYKKDWKGLGYSVQELRDRFKERAIQIIGDGIMHPVDSSRHVFINADSRIALNGVGGGFDLVVFSPPYLNSFDYSDVYRPELFLGNFVNDNLQLRELRSKTLRSHVQYSWSSYDSSMSSRVAALVEELRARVHLLWDKRIPSMVDSYFADLGRVISRAYDLAAPGATMWIVVSTSAYAGLEIPVDLLLAEISHVIGWRLKGVHVLRELRSASQHYNRLKHGGVTVKLRLRESLIRCVK